MKKLFFAILMIAVLAFALATSCKSTDKTTETPTTPVPRGLNMTTFADGQGREWKLIELHIDSVFGREVFFDRNSLVNEGDGEIYTLSFNGQTISGTGAPNRYSTPYTLGSGQSVTVMPIASTLMAPLFQVEKLPEHQFYGYMQNIYEWRSENGNLVFLTKTEDDRDVRMVFGL